MIEEYTLADVVMGGGVLLVLASLFIPGLSPAIGAGIAWATHIYLKANDFYEDEDRTPMKNGVYTEIGESDTYTDCTDCGNRYADKTGYKMLYIGGYEIFRTEQFHSDECEQCELEDEPKRQGERDAEKVKEYA